MECKNIVKERGGVFCSLKNSYYVPSSFELSLYCLSGSYHCCPFLQNQKTYNAPKGGHYSSLSEGRHIYGDRASERGYPEGV